MTAVSLGRLLTAMVTPFKPIEGEPIDFEAVDRLVDHLIDTGTQGLVVRGTTGESPTLSHEEDYALYRRVKTRVAGRVPVIAGTGSNCTRTAVTATQEAIRIGVDAVMLVVPYYNKPSQAGLLAHFRTLARECPIPMILYNIPGRTGVNMLPETVAELSKLPTIVAVKEASGNLEQVRAIRAMTREDFLIYSGDDALTLEIMRLGGHGVISVASHVAGRLMRTLIDHIVAGQGDEATRLNQSLQTLFQNLFCTTNPVPVKAALDMLGLCAPTVRLPLVGCTATERACVHQAMDALGLLVRVSR